MHNNPMEVLKHISKECVPSDLGGCDKTIQELGGMYQNQILFIQNLKYMYFSNLFVEFTKENIIAEKELFLNGLLSLKADMDKKPTDPNSNEQSDLFGCDGNFKQLNID